MKNFTSVADATALERKRARLADKLEAHAARQSRDEAGNASEATRRALVNNRHLSRVLEGPRAVRGPKAQRGSALVAVLAIVATLLLSACSVTLYSREWDARAVPFDECEHDRHNPVTGCWPADDAEPGHNAAGDDR